MAGKGRTAVEDKCDNQYWIRLNNEEDPILTYCSKVTGKPKSQILPNFLLEYYNNIGLIVIMLNVEFMDIFSE